MNYIVKDFLTRISAWKYEWLTDEDQENLAEKDITGEQTPLLRIPDSFESYDHYFSIMFPILMLETMGKVFENIQDKRRTYLGRTITQSPMWFVQEQRNKKNDSQAVNLVFRSNFLSISRILFFSSIGVIF